MIYPDEFPNEVSNPAEERVFEALKKLAGDYDIFYSRRFIGLTERERPEYEIDFIICEPGEALLCIEVKGGGINYDGNTNAWYQNGKRLSVGPDQQASSAMHSLVHRFSSYSKKVPFGWALCFPDCEINEKSFPTSLSEEQIIGHQSILYIEEYLKTYFRSLKKKFSEKKGIDKRWEYEQFKNDLLRGLGFVQVLSGKMKYDENRFVELTERQYEIFSRSYDNKRMIVNGPAGSGKTIVAKTIAQELSDKGFKTLFLCYNRTLANKLGYELNSRQNENLEIASFHSFARRQVEMFHDEWWKEQKVKDDDFWEIEVPLKLQEVFENEGISKYDALIIDEGQDFKEFWFEVLWNVLNKEARITIFLDKHQNIFGRNSSIPNPQSFYQYRLDENCRNTKRIVEYLGKVIKRDIKTFKRNPEGEKVIVQTFDNSISLQKEIVRKIQSLTKEHRVASEQITVLLEGEKKDSSLSELKQIGKLAFKSLDNKARYERGAIHFTSINTFKGLESDIVFIIDVDLHGPNIPLLYTMASRAKHLLYIYSLKGN